MKNLFFILIAAVVFNGCFDVYIYLIPQKDNSYIVTEKISMATNVFSMMSSMNSDKSVQMDSLAIVKVMDSILLADSKKDYGFDKFPGYLSYSIRDSLYDTTAFFITDIHVKNVDLLPAFVKAIQEPAKDSTEQTKPSDLTFVLNVSHPEKMTRFDLTAKRTKKTDSTDLNFWDLPVFTGRGFHIGVLSANLVPQKTKNSLESIAGGQEWFIPFSSLNSWDPATTKKTYFLIRN